jgi:16S rRNA (adenine1518-N6/adenine1519-N6)-dimethyltransferase
MQPKKSLGQNFLKDRKVLEKIIQAADLTPDDLVIEIGPGEGVLTEELIKKTKKVIAIEKDDNLAARLDSRLRSPRCSFGRAGGNDKIKIINDDILKINLPELIEKYFCHSERSEESRDPSRSLRMTSCDVNYKVVANIPYYITSPIIKLFLETQYPPKEMILMVQKEVAERICAKPGKMSILALSVQYYARPELLFYVDKKSFYPVPEVDSAVIRITHNMNCIAPEESKKFFKTVKIGFAAKRKTLINNLANGFHLDKKTVEEKMKKVSLSGTQRAQELSVEDWKKLTEKLS